MEKLFNEDRNILLMTLEVSGLHGNIMSEIKNIFSPPPLLANLKRLNNVRTT